jgi:hypothetical protein
MHKKTSVIMASALAAVLTLAVLAVAIPNQAFAIDHEGTVVAGNGNGNGNGGEGGAGGAGGHGGNGGTTGSGGGNANGGNANGGNGGSANGGSCDGNLNCLHVGGK